MVQCRTEIYGIAKLSYRGCTEWYRVIQSCTEWYIVVEELYGIVTASYRVVRIGTE